MQDPHKALTTKSLYLPGDNQCWEEVARLNGWNVEEQPFHELLVESIGVHRVEAKPSVVIAKLFDGGFRDQTLCGYRLVGTQDGNMGAPVATGFAARFDQSSRYNGHFNRALEDYLLAVGFRGWISFLLSLGGEVVGVSHGLPFLLNFNWFESMGGTRPTQWLKCPKRMLESWSAALLVSKFPFPHQCSGQSQVEVVFQPGMRKHWQCLGRWSAVPGGATTRSLALGVASGWHQTLGGAVRFAQRIARDVGVGEGKQVRGDLRSVVESMIQAQHCTVDTSVQAKDRIETNPHRPYIGSQTA